MLDYLKSLLRPRFESEQDDAISTPEPAVDLATVTPLTPTPLPPKIGEMSDRAEAAIHELSGSLNDWFETDLLALYESWRRFEQSPRDDELLKDLFRASHNLSGMGATYGHPEVGRICRSLCKLISIRNPHTISMLASLHVDACRAMRSTSNPHQEANEICDALEAEVAKLRAA